MRDLIRDVTGPVHGLSLGHGSVTADLLHGRAVRLRLLGRCLHAAVRCARSSTLDPLDDVVAAARGVRSRAVVVRLRVVLTHVVPHPGAGALDVGV